MMMTCLLKKQFYNQIIRAEGRERERGARERERSQREKQEREAREGRREEEGEGGKRKREITKVPYKYGICHIGWGGVRRGENCK
jgi:hypothetical protein